MGCCVGALNHLKDGTAFVYMFLKLIPHSEISCVGFTSSNCPHPPELRRKRKRHPHLKKKKKRHRWNIQGKALKLINGGLTVEVGGDGVARQEAADADLVDDVEQQEGQTGEAERLQELPRVAWGGRRAAVSWPYGRREGRMGGRRHSCSTHGAL